MNNNLVKINKDLSKIIHSKINKSIYNLNIIHLRIIMYSNNLNLIIKLINKINNLLLYKINSLIINKMLIKMIRLNNIITILIKKVFNNNNLLGCLKINNLNFCIQI